MTRPTRCLVTGATGLLGANIGRYLSSHSHGNDIQPIAMNRRNIETPFFAETVRGDLTQLGSLSSAVESARPEILIHAGAMASHEACTQEPELAKRMNVEATAVLAEAAERGGVRFVYISTDAVFDGDRGNYSETDRTNPFSVYGTTKLEGESATRHHCQDSIVVRTNFFGWSPSGTRSILEFFVNSLRAHSSVSGFTDFIVTSIYAQHLAASLWELAVGGHRGVVHVASHDSMSKFEFGRMVADIFALDASLLRPDGVTSSDLTTSRSRDLSLDVSLCESLLSHQLPTQREGIIAARADDLMWTPQ